MQITQEEFAEMMGMLDFIVVNDHKEARSRVWTCAECSRVMASRRLTRPNAPCNCGSICFEKRGVAALPA